VKREYIEQALADLVALTASDDRAESSEVELGAVTIALALEDVFAIRLTDADIDSIDPNDPVALADLLDRARGQR
jgi:acyl carrier protein